MNSARKYPETEVSKRKESDSIRFFAVVCEVDEFRMYIVKRKYFARVYSSLHAILGVGNIFNI